MSERKKCPLCDSYKMTLHKIQGEIYIGAIVFAAGMAYVAFYFASAKYYIHLCMRMVKWKLLEDRLIYL
jgi:hypothetical protein